MFKLLAIRPLEGCASHIQKCLKTGMMYYFCNDYIIEPESHIRRRSKNIKPLKEDFFTVVSESDYSEDNSSGRKSPTVSVSAIVGKNGDGKSTLVELMMRLINNCAISYKLSASSDSLRRVKDVKAELYYMVDNVVYRMAEEEEEETWIWKMTELDDNNGEMMRWEMKPKKIEHVDKDSGCFFFTIVSNYSHYAYNIYDYEKEWEIRGDEKDDDEKCWLHYIFHKNDGYLTPITLHPNRYEGNIDINIEKDLSKQRLLSLFLNAEKPTDQKPTFRRVNGKDANVLVLTEEKTSILQQNTIVNYFRSSSSEKRFKTILDEIERIDKEVDEEVSLINSDYVFMKNYEKLVEFMLPTLFAKPIEQIINQDTSFIEFSSEVYNWLNDAYNDIICKTGDIGIVVERFDTLNEKIEQYTAAITFGKTARIYQIHGDYKKALDYFERAMKITETNLGENYLLLSEIYNSIAETYKDSTNNEKALDYYKKTMEIMESRLEIRISDLVPIYHIIAGLYRNNGNYEKSLEYYEKYVELLEMKLDKDQLELVVAYSKIADEYRYNGNYKKALEYYKKTVAMLETVLEKDLSDKVVIFSNIALVYLALNDYESALEYNNDALKIVEKKGKNHPDKAIIFNNIAMIYTSMGDYVKALFYYKKASETIGFKMKNLSGMAKKYYNSALKYKSEGLYYYALENYINAMKIIDSELIKDKAKVAFAYFNIAMVYECVEEFDNALENYKIALEICKRNKTQPLMSIVQYYMAGVYRIKGDYGDAINYYKNSNRMQLKKLIEHQNNNRGNKDKESGNIQMMVDVKSVEEEYALKKKEIDNTIKKHVFLYNTKYKFLSAFNSSQLGRLDTLYRIMKSYNIDPKIVTKNYSELTLKEKCLQYLIYKVLSILSGSPKYEDVFNVEIDSLRECSNKLEECVEDIKNDHNSHITRELRQVMSFIEEIHDGKGLYDCLGRRDEKNNLLVEIDDLRNYYKNKSISLDNLPPPIYKWQIIFMKKDSANCSIESDSFSSGEKQMLNSIGAIIYHLQNLNHTASEVKYKNVNLIMEEIELYYHPEYQRLFLSWLLDMIRRAKLGSIKNINIVFVTHSPFILSDTPKCNVLFLKDGMPKDIMQENTFGANIHTLLKNGFFMPNLPIGEFAYGKINKLFGKLNSGELDPDNDLDDIYQEILLVGEPFLRNQLLMLYNSYKGSHVMPMNTYKKGTKS